MCQKGRQEQAQDAPAASDGNGVGEQVTGQSSGLLGSLLPGQQGPDPAEDPDGTLQVHQLVVQGPPLACFLQVSCLAEHDHTGQELVAKMSSDSESGLCEKVVPCCAGTNSASASGVGHKVKSHG